MRQVGSVGWLEDNHTIAASWESHPTARGVGTLRFEINNKVVARTSTLVLTSASTDIRNLFTVTCDQLGVEWRQMNQRNISIARRDSVARLDEFIGPKA
jgi:hypothetical protein